MVLQFLSSPGMRPWIIMQQYNNITFSVCGGNVSGHRLNKIQQTGFDMRTTHQGRIVETMRHGTVIA